jgi:DNA-binding NtrC family response regulator
LRERRQDIEALARGMRAGFADRFHKSLLARSPGALIPLQSFPWPDNVRQLENAVPHAVLVSSGPELVKAHLPVCVCQPAFALRSFPNR